MLSELYVYDHTNLMIKQNCKIPGSNDCSKKACTSLQLHTAALHMLSVFDVHADLILLESTLYLHNSVHKKSIHAQCCIHCTHSSTKS